MGKSTFMRQCIAEGLPKPLSAPPRSSRSTSSDIHAYFGSLPTRASHKILLLDSEGEILVLFLSRTLLANHNSQFYYSTVRVASPLGVFSSPLLSFPSYYSQAPTALMFLQLALRVIVRLRTRRYAKRSSTKYIHAYFTFAAVSSLLPSFLYMASVFCRKEI